MASTVGQRNISSSQPTLDMMKHWNKSRDFSKAGYVSKDDFAVALRGHQAAVDATKSPQREEAAEFYKYIGRN